MSKGRWGLSNDYAASPFDDTFDGGVPGKRSLTQGLPPKAVPVANRDATAVHKPIAAPLADPFDFSFGSGSDKPVTPADYQYVYDALPQLLKSIVHDQVEQCGGGQLERTTWTALQQATGKPSEWLWGFVVWLHAQMLPTAATLERPSDGKVEYTGTTSTDEQGHKQYKGVFQGSRFPDAGYRNDAKVLLNATIKDEYLVALDEALPDVTKGMKLLMTAMTKMEGFNKDSASYKTHNPGNIGNKDTGDRKLLTTLADGVALQYRFLLDVAEGSMKAYPLNKKVTLAPYYSEEIAKHSKTYGISPYLPGYEFVYTGQLDQFIKIYSTGARAGNGYLNTIVSYFAQNDIAITPESKLQDIIKMQ